MKMMTHLPIDEGGEDRDANQRTPSFFLLFSPSPRLIWHSLTILNPDLTRMLIGLPVRLQLVTHVRSYGRD